MAFEVPIRKVLVFTDGKYKVVERELHVNYDLKNMINEAIETRKKRIKELNDSVYENELQLNQLQQLLSEV